MNDSTTKLSISTTVIEAIAETAVKEIDGVIGLSKKNIDLKGIVKNKNALKGVKIENENGALKITAYITVKQNITIKDIAQKVQLNIKEKIQNMTGTAVTQVNVNIADIVFEPDSAEN